MGLKPKSRGLKAKSRVAALRANAGLTQAQLAVFVGVTTNTIQNWEKESGLDQLEKYIKLCEVLGCNLLDLIEYVPAPEAEEPKSKGFSLDELREIRERWGIGKNSPGNDSPPNSEHEEQTHK